MLIYAAVPGHPLGEQVAALFRSAAPATMTGIGSVLLLPEVLSRPLRDGATDEVRILAALLARLDLRPVDRATAELATALSSRYRLKAADATHLATAVGMGADRFITSNKRDFPAAITEIQVTYPADLADPTDGDTSTVEGMLAELVRRGGEPVRMTACCWRPGSTSRRLGRYPGCRRYSVKTSASTSHPNG
ncbi:MAG: type II toxin-antitoxin system VapC family toxin [Streptosporangiaceae bacterium]